MNIIYLRDQELASRLDTLTYAELRRLLPDIRGVRLPRPVSLLDDRRDRFLEVSETDFSVRIYANGLFLYREPGEATVFAVSRCGRIAFPSVTGEPHIVDMSDCVWFLPLKIAGENRVDRNRNSREEYHCAYRFEADSRSAARIPDALTPCTPDFAREPNPEAEKLARREKYAVMKTSLHHLTRRQTELTLLYHGGMNMSEIAENLGIRKSTVSKTLRRARERLKIFS